MSETYWVLSGCFVACIVIVSLEITRRLRHGEPLDGGWWLLGISIAGAVLMALSALALATV